MGRMTESLGNWWMSGAQKKYKNEHTKEMPQKMKKTKTWVWMVLETSRSRALGAATSMALIES